MLKIAYIFMFKQNFSNSEKIIKLGALLLLIFLVIVIFFSQVQVYNLDIGRHLKNGEMVFSNPAVLYQNAYSFTMLEEPFINHHWLSGVVYFLIYKAGGFGLLLLSNIIIAISVVLLAFSIAAKRSNFWLACLAAVLPVLMLSQRNDIRPEMFSYLLIILFIFLIERYENSGRRLNLYALLALQALWVNLHIYFFIGPLIFAAYLLAKAAESVWSSAAKRARIDLAALKQAFTENSKNIIFYLSIMLGLGASSLLNPNFIQGALYPLFILKDYGYTIAENMSPWFMENLQINYNITIFKILLALAALSYAAAITLKSKKFSYLDLLFLFSAAISFRAIRNFPVFAIFSLIILADNLDFIPAKLKKIDKLLPAAAIFLIISSLAFCFYDYSQGRWFIKNKMSLSATQSTAKAAEFFRNNLKGPFFNNYDLGSALIFYLYPETRVFVDNRPEAYGSHFFNSIYKPMMEDETAWNAYCESYGINAVIISHTDATPWARTFLFRILADPKWPLVYLDEKILILAKNNSDNASLIKREGYNDEKIRQRIKELSQGADLYSLFYLSDLAYFSGYHELSQEIISVYLQSNPRDGRAWALLSGYVLADNKSESIVQSIDYLNRAIDSGFRLPSVYIRLGLNYFYLGDIDAARENWEKALRYDKNNSSAKEYLKQLEQLNI